MSRSVMRVIVQRPEHPHADYLDGRSFDITDGLLTVFDSAVRRISVYAPGAWDSVEVTYEREPLLDTALAARLHAWKAPDGTMRAKDGEPANAYDGVVLTAMS